MSHLTNKIDSTKLAMSENETDFNSTIAWLDKIVADKKGRGLVHLADGQLYPFLHIEDKYRVVKCQKAVKSFEKIINKGHKTAYDAMKGIDKWIGDIDRATVGAGSNHIYFQYPAADGTATRFAIIYFDPYFY